jgi:hypothetical protein
LRQYHEAKALSSSLFTGLPVTRSYSAACVSKSRSKVEHESSPGYQGWSVFSCGSPTPAAAADGTTKRSSKESIPRDMRTSKCSA